VDSRNVIRQGARSIRRCTAILVFADFNVSLVGVTLGLQELFVILAKTLLVAEESLITKTAALRQLAHTTTMPRIATTLDKLVRAGLRRMVPMRLNEPLQSQRHNQQVFKKPLQVRSLATTTSVGPSQAPEHGLLDQVPAWVL
jgi:hypothetical protein